MRFHSLRNRSESIDFARAVRAGLAGDGGLLMPDELPRLPAHAVGALRGMEPAAIALQIARALFADDVDDAALERIVTQTVDFPIPLVRADDGTYVLELFHGPTLAFKDVGARFLARMLAHLSRGEETPLTVLVATSGDTGGAVAQGFHGVDGVDVVVLYPSGQVSPIQESQFATLGGNVAALEVHGTFDDCQSLVKRALTDGEILSVRALTSANSINVARLLPQTFYYFMAVGALPRDVSDPVYSVPCGNLGNLTAGVMAGAMGLPASLFLAAANANDVLPEYLRTGQMRARPSVRTISNAMDVGDPSNFERLASLFDGDLRSMRRLIRGSSWTDDATRETIRLVHDRCGYVLDPHAAVAYRAWQEYVRGTAGMPGRRPGIVLATAHPAKFLESYDDRVRASVTIPDRLSARMGQPKRSLPMPARYEDFKDYLCDTRTGGVR
jgi:threonine synthase